jgi:hypothetical protein
MWRLADRLNSRAFADAWHRAWHACRRAGLCPARLEDCAGREGAQNWSVRASGREILGGPWPPGPRSPTGGSSRFPRAPPLIRCRGQPLRGGSSPARPPGENDHRRKPIGQVVCLRVRRRRGSGRSREAAATSSAGRAARLPRAKLRRSGPRAWLLTRNWRGARARHLASAQAGRLRGFLADFVLRFFTRASSRGAARDAVVGRAGGRGDAR